MIHNKYYTCYWTFPCNKLSIKFVNDLPCSVYVIIETTFETAMLIQKRCTSAIKKFARKTNDKTQKRPEKPWGMKLWEWVLELV